MMLLNRLPLPRWIKGPAGCGCTAASCLGGCGGPTCIGCGCFPILGLFFAIAVIIAIFGRQPDFAPALFCRNDLGERDRGAVCDSDSAKASLTLRLDDLPAAAYDEYKAADKAESLPWFIFGAWERVATNFGQRGGGSVSVDIPGEALRAYDESRTANINLIAEVLDGDRLEISPGSVDMTSLQSLFPNADRTDPQVALRSELRGGSFGLFIVTGEEYMQFGRAGVSSNERAIDAWDREDGAAIVARLLEARFNERQATGENFYRFPAIGEAERLGTEIATYLSGLAARAATAPKTEEALKDPENLVRQVMLILNGDFCADERGFAVLRDCGFLEEDVSDSDAANFSYSEDAPGGLRGRGPNDGERRALCLAVLPADTVRERCSRFEALPEVTEVPPSTTFDDWLGSIYTPVGEVPDWTVWDWKRCGPPGAKAKPNDPNAVPEDIPVSPGYDVCDWNELLNVFGDLIDDPGVWGMGEGDPTATYEVELVGPDGSRESFAANVYAEAMLRYGRSLFEADLERQMAGIDYGTDIAEFGAIGRLDLPALRVWHPGIIAVAPEMGAIAAGDENPVARAYLRALITTKLKGVDPVDLGSGCDYYQRERKPILPLPGVETGNGSSPSNVVGCTLFGRGTVSYYASEKPVDGRFSPATDAFVAMNHCSLTFRLLQKDETGAGINCGNARIRVLDENGAVVAEGTFPVRDYCDCFVIASESYPIVSLGTTVRKPRIADLSGGALKQLGLDSSLGLYEVELGLIPPAEPINWSDLILRGAELDAGTLATPTPAILWLLDELIAAPGFPGVQSAGVADWIVAAEHYCRTHSESADCIVDPQAPGTEISDPLTPEAPPRTVVLSPFGRSLLRALERFGAGPAKSWPIAADGSFNQRWGCTGYIYEPPRGNCAHYHNGIDLGASLNTKMLAVAPGKVTWAGPSSYNTVTRTWPVQLWLVIVLQDDGYTSVYGHSGDGLPGTWSPPGKTTRYEHGCAPLVQRGDRVRAGQEIGCVGMTGHTTGPHIHFTMYRGSRLRDIDPCSYLPPMPSGRPPCRQGPDAYP